MEVCCVWNLFSSPVSLRTWIESSRRCTSPQRRTCCGWGCEPAASWRRASSLSSWSSGEPYESAAAAATQSHSHVCQCVTTCFAKSLITRSAETPHVSKNGKWKVYFRFIGGVGGGMRCETCCSNFSLYTSDLTTVANKGQKKSLLWWWLPFEHH